MAIATLGCKVNLFESEMMAQSLRSRQWRIVDADRFADLYVINTCTVTQEADRQARQTIRRLIRQNPRARIVVTGCYAQMDSESCAQIPGVDLVLGNDRKLDLAEYIETLHSDSNPKIMVGDLSEHVSLPQALLSGFDAKTRAYVQIQQGCDQGCTFCIIHRARGPSRSLPATVIRNQVKRLLGNGYREVVICGVDLGSYGKDLRELAELSPTNSYDLVALLQSLCELDGDFRIRLSSIDPAHISDHLIELMANEPKLCPHLHLSLQSGNTLILKRMKRRYDANHVYNRIEKLRQSVPDLVLSADVMVGFPTEEEDHFMDTKDMLRHLEVAFPHVFSYSNRAGTPASRIPAERQISPEIKKLRARQLRRLGDEIRTRVLHSRLGARSRVLVEKTTSGQSQDVFARAADYLPVRFSGVEVKPGQFVEVRMVAAKTDHLIAEVTA